MKIRDVNNNTHPRRPIAPGESTMPPPQPKRKIVLPRVSYDCTVNGPGVASVHRTVG